MGMKLLSIQPPYPVNLEECEPTFAFILDTLHSCDAPNGIILTPEYSNAAGPLPPAEFCSFALARAEALRSAACEAARRNQAIVILSYAKPVGDGRFRNATEAIGRDGTSLGVYFKQHLTPTELGTPGMDGAYSNEFNPMPVIVSDDGLRMGFITCYDVYFDEFIMRLAAKRPDIVFVSSFQRSERQEIIRKQSSLLAFNCGSFVLRSSFSMGASASVGGCSLAVSPEGSIIADMGNRVGVLECDVADLRQKHLRSYCHGGALIDNNQYIALGRAPWSYRSCGCATIPGDRQQPFPRLCAHRGFSRACPENTLPAFGTAIALGACEIELDVRFTKDGVPVSCHDDRLDRIANGSGRVADITFEEY
jgi:predicted amidohydrolase